MVPQQVTINEATIRAVIIGPILSRPSIPEWNNFVSTWIRRKNRDERLGQAFLKRYSMHGYENSELWFASNSKAFQMLNNHIHHGVLKILRSA